MNTFSSAMSIAATWIWAPALFVSAERAYLNGWVGLFWFLVPNILCLILFIPFAKKIREQMPKGITLSGYMYNKYKSRKVKNVYLFQLTSLTILSTAVQLLAGGKILSSVTGIPFYIITIVLSIIALSYSAISGIRASVITDTLQMLLILIACLVFVPWALNIDNGIQNLIAGFTGVTREYTSLFNTKGLEVFFAFGLPTAIGLIAGPFGDQCFWQRTFSIKKKK
ncbi:sodium:solute symporter family transporter [Clostridioides difficile]